MRPFPTHTPLGKALRASSMTVAQLSAASGVYNRTLTEYLAGRKLWSVRHLTKVAEALNVEPEELMYQPETVDVG